MPEAPFRSALLMFHQAMSFAGYALAELSDLRLGGALLIGFELILRTIEIPTLHGDDEPEGLPFACAEARTGRRLGLHERVALNDRPLSQLCELCFSELAHTALLVTWKEPEFLPHVAG